MSHQWKHRNDDAHQPEFSQRDADCVSNLVALDLAAMAGNAFGEPTAAQEEQLHSLCLTAVHGIHDLYDLLTGTLIPIRSSDPQDPAELVDTAEVLDESDAEHHMDMLADYVDALDEYLNEMTPEWYLGRRLGEPLPDRIKDGVVAALNAGFDPPPTDAEIASFVARFDKVVTLHSHVQWVRAGNAVIRFTGADGTEVETVAASALSPADLARYGDERISADFVAVISEEDVAAARAEGKLPEVRLSMEEADLDDDDQVSTSPVLRALACGLAATKYFEALSEEELVEIHAVFKRGSFIHFVADILSGEMIPIRSKVPDAGFKLKPLETVLSEEDAAQYRDAFKDATEAFKKATIEWCPQWMVGRGLRRPFPPETRQYLETAIRAGFDPPATDDEIRKIVDSLEQDFREFSEVWWVAGGNGVIHSTKNGLVFASADELSPEDRARYRQERAALGLVTAISEEDVAEALRTGVKLDVELK